MSDLEKKLNATTDAQIWAEEFCKLFDVFHKVNRVPAPANLAQYDQVFIFYDLKKLQNEDLMVGWFANAIEVGRQAGKDSMEFE